MIKSFKIKVSSQELFVTGNYEPFEADSDITPGNAKSFDCEKIEVIVKGYNQTMYIDITEFVFEINPKYIETINKKIIEQIKENRNVI